MLESTFAVRPAVQGEAGVLHDLAALTFPLACPPSTSEAAKAAFIEQHLSREAFKSYLVDPQRLVLVAERPAGAGEAAAEPAELIGYAMLVHGEPSDLDVARAVQGRPTAELSKLYVHQAQHGGGIASELVEHALLAAAVHGAVSVWLGVNIYNARANRFYEKAGFEVVGRKGFLVGEVVEDDYVRERPLR